MDDLDKRIAEANAEFVGAEDVGDNDVTNLTPVDLYQERQKELRQDRSMNYPRGSSALVLATVKNIVEGAGTNSLALAYKRAKDDSELLKKNGSIERAQLVCDQYNEEKFLPAVELTVNLTSPDELLNSREALAILDKYVLGVGNKQGFTASYVRSAYQNMLGRTRSLSDSTVQHFVERINGLLDTDQMRAAQGLADRVKKMVDKGEHIASEQDYLLIRKVANG